jgi:C4-dicarboxylate transporter DctM subunit
MDYSTAALLCASSMLILMMLGIPIAYALGFSAVVFGALAFGSISLNKAGWATFHLLYTFTWTPLPLFVLMACIIAETTIGEDLYHAARSWLSRVPGGLIVATVMGQAAMAAVVGVSGPCIVALGKVAEPEFKRYGYNRALSLGGLCCGGVLGPLIPPSVPMIIFAAFAEVSLGRLFIAGIMPGILLAIMLATSAIILCSRNPALGRPVGGVTWKERFSSLKRVWPIVLVMLFILGTIYLGVATPTEAGGVGCTIVLIIAITSFGFRLKGLYRAMIEAALINGMIMVILVAASFFSYVLGSSHLADILLGFITSSGMTPILVIISINILLLILGCLMEPITIMMLTLPIITPVITGLGFDLIWFGVVFLVNMEIGLITPPMGINLFIARNTFGISTGELIKGVLPFLVVLLIFLFLLVALPQLSLWLPDMMRGR